MTPDVKVFDTPGTFIWNKPAGATIVEVLLIGGGGGGGGCINGNKPGDGGAGGDGLVIVYSW